MKIISVKTKSIAALLTLCIVLSSVSVAAFASGINYIKKIHVSYTYVEYKAGEEPRATAAVTEGECTVAYEYWREIHQLEAGGVWSGTGRYWYSDPAKMAALPAEKQITRFEAGKHYSYNIVLAANRGSFIGDDETIVSVGEYEWGTPGRNTNLEIKDMSTTLYIYSPYSIVIPADSTDNVITDVAVVNVSKELDHSAPVSFTASPAASCAGLFDVTEEGWEAARSESDPRDDVIKSTDAAPRAPIAGREYWYSIVLTAKDGYVFSKDLSDDSFRIKEGSGVTFTLDGVSYKGAFHVSDDGKTLTAWEFMAPVTVVSTGAPQTTGGDTVPDTTGSATDSGAPDKSQPTGDSSNSALWLWLLLVSAGVLIAVAVTGIRKKRIR